MREVSQNWLNNQNKTLRDQGLLRLDFLSAHDNNTYAHIIPMGSDASKSNINEIKEIYPYGAPTKNLAMPNLIGKEYLGDGEYLLWGNEIDFIKYNVHTGVYWYNGNVNITEAKNHYNPINISGYFRYSAYYISGTFEGSTLNLNYYDINGNDILGIYDFKYDNKSIERNDGILLPYFNVNGKIFNNYKYKTQIEVGSQATDYVVPQPNTGYVSTAITNPDGTLTPAGSDYVPIEVNVEDYRSPLNGLTITWSENFGHAVDYSIEYNGEIYTYLNNTKKTVFVPIVVENTPDANFKIRVHKWSQGGVPIRIERVFVGLHIINYQDRIFSYSKKRVNDVLSLELPQDEINFELSNVDRMFDPLWYNSYFKYLNEKTEIRVYSGFKLDGKNAEWIKNGTFYLTDWKAPNNSITASFTARDILNLLDADEMYSKSGALTLDDYCDIILGRDYKGVDNFENYNLPVNPDGSKKWNIRKNLAAPDLTGKPEISEGVYRLYDANGVTIDYDYWTGEFTINGTSSETGSILRFPQSIVGNYNISYYYISGQITSGFLEFSRKSGASGLSIGSTTYMNDRNETREFTSPNANQLDFTAYADSNYIDLTFKLQLEQGVEATDYELPIENATVPVSMETRTKREVLQLLAQSVNAHIHLDDDANISFIRDVTGQQLNADKKIMFTKPEFNIAAPVKKIIVPISTYTSDPSELELARIQLTVGAPNKNLAMPDLTGKPEISAGVYRLYDDNGITIDYEVKTGIFTINGTSMGRINCDITSTFPAGVYSASSYYVSGSIDDGGFNILTSPWDRLNINYNSGNYNTNRATTEYVPETYVRFVSAEARTIRPVYTNDGVTLQYSIDSGATWTTIASGASTISATEHWFRGQATGTKSLFTSHTYTNEWKFSGSSDLEVYGNLNFLLCDTLGDTEAPTSLGTYAYSYMFSGCTSLTTAPELPATTLGDYCYGEMFYNCTSLTRAPKLPATILTESCYYNMFLGCTSLTTAPELPATTLASECYRQMFLGCTSLTTAPELPATTLADSCYYAMFRNCTSLTTAPELPATTLTELCYGYMFNGCTSFKVSETNTGSYIYPWRIPTSGTGAEATSWNTNMLTNTGGTFKSDPTINTTYWVENEPVSSENYVSKYVYDGNQFNISISTYQANSTFNQYKFKYQLEEGPMVTDYVVHNPNTSEVIEINHDLPYSGGRVEVSGALTVASQDNTWFRSYKIVVVGSGSGELVLFRHQMARTTINILQDVGSSGTTMTYENPMIDTKLKASHALTKIWSEISNNRQVEFDLRIDPRIDTFNVVSFPFNVLNLEQREFMRIDELEINYNGSYKGKIKGVILSNYGEDLKAIQL